MPHIFCNTSYFASGFLAFLFCVFCVYGSNNLLPLCLNDTIGRNKTFCLHSPGYPNRYPEGTRCSYSASTPKGYVINMTCNIDIPTSQNCTKDYFLVSEQGDMQLNHAEHFCGKGVIQRPSILNTITLGVFSSRYSNRGSFLCEMKSKRELCDCGWSTANKSFDGGEVQVHEFPFMAGVVSVVNRIVICGGSIITDRFIITAAHCVARYDQDVLAVIVGDHDISTGKDTPYTQLLPVKEIITHEHYDFYRYLNDIALLRTRKMEWSIGVGPVCLPFLYTFADFAGYDVEIVGWGTNSHGGPVTNVLMKASTTVVSSQKCNTHDTILCTHSNTSDSCQLDSGGPVVLRRDRMFLVGVIAFGRGCEGLGYNTRITSFLDWIQNKTAKYSFCRKSL